MDKKNPYVMTIGFNREDPDHVYVADFLNSMGRGKARYIVKAVMLYQDMQERGEVVSIGESYDYERIRRMVLQVIEKREQQMGVPVKEVSIPMEEKKELDPDMFTNLEEDVLNGIMVSLAAFKQK